MDTSRRTFITSVALASAAAVLSSRGSALGRAVRGPFPAEELDALLDGALVFDGSGAVSDRELDEAGWQVARRSGLTAIHTSLADRSLAGALADLAFWQARFDRHPDHLVKVLKASDIEQAKRNGNLGIVLGFQNASCIEDDVANLTLLSDAGARSIQLTDNSRNLLGDGCLGPSNAGLSDFGVGAVETMNELGIVVDISNCGERTSRDAVAVSRKPPAFTHTMCQARCDHPRAKSDELLRAIADRGGMIGIVPRGTWIGPNRASSLADYLDDIEHAVRVAGVDHVGLASDYPAQGIEDAQGSARWHDPRPASFNPGGSVRWPRWLSELDRGERFRTTARGLAGRGYREREIEKVLGLNWIAYFREVFGA